MIEDMLSIASWRARRQLTVILIILGFLGWIGFRLAIRFVPEPSCSDTRRNNGEVGVDCGGPCAPCELKSPKALSIFWARSARSAPEAYDAVTLVENVNDVLSSQAVEYEFTLLDDLGIIGRKSGTTFIYPQERLYIVEPSIRTSREPTKVEFTIRNISWQVGGAEQPALIVERREHRLREENSRVESVVEAQIFNSGPHRFREMEVVIVVFDDAGNVLGANRVVASDIGGGERRTITSIWPNAFSGSVARIEVYPRVNLFDPSAIMQP